MHSLPPKPCEFLQSALWLITHRVSLSMQAVSIHLTACNIKQDFMESKGMCAL
jgi:hypothetical protein